MGVYGSFIDNFIELLETITFEKGYSIRAVYLPASGSQGVRKKFTSNNWGTDISDDDILLVPQIYTGKITIGDRFTYNNDNKTIVGVSDYTVAGDFAVYKVDRIQGHSSDQNQKLEVKGAKFI